MPKYVALFGVAFLKVFAMAVYSAWAVKFLVSESPSPLFGLLALVLSIYGLWVIIRNVSDYWLKKGTVRT